MDASLATLREHLEPLDFQFKRMSECHIYLVRSASTPTARSDPLEVEWWETSSVYLIFLKKLIKRAKRRPDLYNLALYQRQLLTAILSGVSESVSYNDSSLSAKI